MPWSGHQAATIAQYVRQEVTDTVVKKKLFLRELDRGGRIKYDGSGTKVVFPIRYKRTGLSTNGEGTVLSFPQIDKRKTAEFNMRGYVATQGLNQWNKIQNQGKEAIIRLWENIINELIDDVRFHFNQKLINVDGYAAGNELEVVGLESMFGYSTTHANNKTAAPDDTYGGLSTKLQNYGGTFTGTWPVGYGDTQYDFWSPIIALATASGWAATTDNWKNNSIEIIRFCHLNAQRNGDMLDFIMMAQDYYQEHLSNLDAKEQAQVMRGSTNPGDVTFGFANVWQDGLRLVWEVDCPSRTAYGISLSTFQLKCWTKQLIVPEMDYDMDSQSDRVALKFYGNLMCTNPRANCKIRD